MEPEREAAPAAEPEREAAPAAEPERQAGPGPAPGHGIAPGAWPLLGHLPYLVARPLDFLDALPAYGDVVRVRMVPAPSMS
ncbi:hypothetical protein [Streptomyces sp. NBC_00572]|uniref:hypothetical protein n=1 Tax=Streptomyces sp. NBC_00572 TaxID=2903664 RepID=UPI00225B97D3|nr:hypothetical protein [Streptomyces sp. NBC_00572]